MHSKSGKAKNLTVGNLYTRTISTVARLVSTALALAMLISLPAESAHTFPIHLRAPVVRRSARRHICVAEPEASAAEQLPACPSLPLPLVPIDHSALIDLPLESTSNTEIPLTRLLRHLKVRIARSSSPDPLS